MISLQPYFWERNVWMNDTDCMNHQNIFRSNLISSWCQLLCMSSRWGFSSQFTHLSEELTWLLTRQRRQKIHYVENKEIIACGWMSPFRVTFSITFLVSFLLMLPKLDQLFLQYASMISWLLLVLHIFRVSNFSRKAKKNHLIFREKCEKLRKIQIPSICRDPE